MDNTSNEEDLTMTNRNAGVTISQSPCEGTALDGYWMAIDCHGRNLCARRDPDEALRTGIEMSERTRGAVCGSWR